MFKKILLGFFIIIVIFVGFISFQLVSTKSYSPVGNALFSDSIISISIDYHKPFMKGRNIFGGLVPYGKYWRTGANNATEIEFSKEIFFGGKLISAGRYRLYSIPNEDSWTIVLNSELDKWGLFEPDYNLDLLKVEAKSTALAKSKEQFEILLQENNKALELALVWDKTKVIIPLSWEVL